MRGFRNAALIVAALLALARPVDAQITLPYPLFTAGTVISPTQVNANNTQLATYALNRSAGVMTGHLTFGTDNTHDIGATGATRPRDLHVARNALIGGTLGVTGNFAVNTSAFTVTASTGAVGTTGDISLGLGKLLKYSATAYMTPENNTTGAEVSTPGVFIVKTGASPAERMRVNDTGLGIGLTPTSALHLAESALAAGGIAFGSDTNLYRAGASALKTDDNLTVSGGLGVGVAASGSQALTFAEGTTAGAGILFGTDTNLYRSAANTLKTDDAVTIGSTLGVTGAATLSSTLGVSGATTLSGNLAVDTSVLYVDTSSNEVGINDSTPDYSLDVNGRAQIANASASTEFVLQLANASTTAGQSHGLYISTAGSSASDDVIYAVSATGVLFRVTGIGGVSFPSAGTTASAANAFMDGAASNLLLRSTSSARYKSDIRPLDRGLDVVLGLRPVTYLAKDKPAGPRYPGFIAEEVAPLEPILATYDKDGRPDYVQYDRVTAYLVNAVKELAARVEQLEAELVKARQR